MKLSSFLLIKAIITLAFAIGFLLIPESVWSIYGVTLDSAGVLMVRFCGACFMGIGLICWITRNSNSNALKSITLSLFICDTIGFVVALTGQLSGKMNPLGWIIVVLWLLLALGLGYFRFLNQAIPKQNS